MSPLAHAIALSLQALSQYQVESIIVLWVLCVCTHFRGLTSQRAAQCNGILISILVFPLKPHYMKLLLHASTQIQLSYLRICIFHFSFVPIDLPMIYDVCIRDVTVYTRNSSISCIVYRVSCIVYTRTYTKFYKYTKIHTRNF